MRGEKRALEPGIRVDLEEDCAAGDLRREVVRARQIPLGLERCDHKAQARVVWQERRKRLARAPVNDHNLIQRVESEP